MRPLAALMFDIGPRAATLLAPNGAPVLLGREDRANRIVFHIIDPATWTELAQWSAEGFAQPLLLP